MLNISSLSVLLSFKGQSSVPFYSETVPTMALFLCYVKHRLGMPFPGPLAIAMQ